MFNLGKKAKRPDGGDIYHGGCDGCVTPQKYCSECRYFARPWDRKDYSSQALIKKALADDVPESVFVGGVEYTKSKTA